jgi:hypothetical protein
MIVTLLFSVSDASQKRRRRQRFQEAPLTEVFSYEVNRQTAWTTTRKGRLQLGEEPQAAIQR